MRRHKERGMALLLEVLIVSAILLTIAAVAIPAGFKWRQIANENNAGSALAQIGLAETQYAHVNSAYVPLQFLTGTFSLPVSCSNPFILSGAQTQNPVGYTMTPVFSGAPSSAFNCAAISGAGSSFTINADPASPIDGIRHFYTDATGIVRYNDEHSAGPADPQFTTTLYALSTNTGGSNNNAGTSGVATWSSGTSYPAGTEVIRPTDVNGYTCTTSIFFNTSGNNNGDPGLDTADWAPLGSTAATCVNTLAVPTLSNPSANFSIGTGRAWSQTYFSPSGVGYSTTYSRFSVNVNGGLSPGFYGGGGGAVGLMFLVEDTTTGTNIASCYITFPNTPGIGTASNSQCTGSGSTMTVNPGSGDALAFSYTMITSSLGTYTANNGPYNFTVSYSVTGP